MRRNETTGRLEISGTLAVFEQKSETKWHFPKNLQHDSILCDSSHCDECLALDQDDCFLRDELQSMLLETSISEKTLQSISSKPVKQFDLFLLFAHSPQWFLALDRCLNCNFFPHIFPECNLAVLFDSALRPQAKGRFLFFPRLPWCAISVAVLFSCSLAFWPASWGSRRMADDFHVHSPFAPTAMHS